MATTKGYEIKIDSKTHMRIFIYEDDSIGVIFKSLCPVSEIEEYRAEDSGIIFDRVYKGYFIWLNRIRLRSHSFIAMAQLGEHLLNIESNNKEEIIRKVEDIWELNKLKK